MFLFNALVVCESQSLYPASVSPFSEPTSPNIAISLHGDTTKALHTYGGYLMQCLPKYIQQFSVLKDELTVYVAPSALVQTLQFLRDHSQCQFKSLIDISGADYPTRDKRFEIVYHLVSIRYATRIRVKTYADEVDPVPSAAGLFSGANWYVSSLAMSFSLTGIVGTSERRTTCTGSTLPTILTCAVS